MYICCRTEKNKISLLSQQVYRALFLQRSCYDPFSSNKVMETDINERDKDHVIGLTTGEEGNGFCRSMIPNPHKAPGQVGSVHASDR